MWFRETEESDEHVLSMMVEDGNQRSQRCGTATPLAENRVDRDMGPALTVATHLRATNFVER